MYVFSDSDKSVGQSAGAALLLWLSRGVVGEHSLEVETQHETQETAGLTILIETHEGQVRAALSHIHVTYSYTVYKLSVFGLGIERTPLHGKGHSLEDDLSMICPEVSLQSHCLLLSVMQRPQRTS